MLSRHDPLLASRPLGRSARGQEGFQPLRGVLVFSHTFVEEIPVLLPAIVGKPMTLAAAEQSLTGWEIEDAGTPLARLAVDDQRTKKPVTPPAEVAGRGVDPHPVMMRGMLSPVRGAGVIEPKQRGFTLKTAHGVADGARIFPTATPTRHASRTWIQQANALDVEQVQNP